jgi:hypothetical protein
MVGVPSAGLKSAGASLYYAPAENLTFLVGYHDKAAVPV